jgi:hypothetical protein
MELPAELQEGFRQELYEFEEAQHMPYVTSIERLAEKRGLQRGLQKGARAELLETIQALLKDKFGSAGSRLLARCVP